MLAETEAFLFKTLARELADKYSLDCRVLSLEIRNLFKAHRTSTPSRQAKVSIPYTYRPAPCRAESCP